MKTIISSQRTSLSFDYENQRKLMKEERFAGKQNSAGEMGHRIAKHVYTSANVLEKSTYYVLDATGNTMATYERAVDENTLQISYTHTEKFIYGSSRLGVQNCNIALLGSQNNTYTQTTVPHRIGKKGYELSNHLGNVLSVISDKVIPHPSSTSGGGGSTVDYWQADILQSTDYSPFGVQLNNRSLSKSGLTDFVRFGFNSHEDDYEIVGKGNHLSWGNFGMDPRLGRRWNIDPQGFRLPEQSPYVININSPVSVTDPDGEFGIFGALIGAAGGLIYGSIKYGFSDGAWKKTLAATFAGAVGGATLGLGTAAIASFAAAGTTGAAAIVSGSATIGAANTIMIIGGVSILSSVSTELVNQSVLNVFGVQHGFDKESFIATLSVALPSALVGGVLDKLGGRVLNELSMHQAKKLGVEIAYKAQKEFISENKKLIKNLGKESGVKISDKTAKKAAIKMWDTAVESKNSITNMTVTVSEKTISIGTVVCGEVTSDKIKEEIK